MKIKKIAAALSVAVLSMSMFTAFADIIDESTEVNNDIQVSEEEELKSKLARLDELNILLNMDKKENEIVGGEPDEGESTEKRKEKSYER